MTRHKLLATGGLWAALAAGGCATARSDAGGHRARDVRGTTRMLAAQSRLAIVGPAHLLHVDYTGDDALELVAVQRGPNAANCEGPVRGRIRLHANRPNVLDVDVLPDEAICVAAPARLRREVAVSWHAVGAADPIAFAPGAAASPAALQARRE